MKMKRFIAIAMCLCTVLTITAACSKNNGDDVTVYETDVWGETVTNENGENVTVNVEGSSIEYVTDENGNQILDSNGEKMTILHYYVNDVDADGNVVTNANKDPVTKEYTSSNETTSSKIDIGDILESELTTGKIETMPEGTTIATSDRLFDKNYRDIISSGDFYIDMVMNGNMEGLGLSTNVAFAVSGDKMYVNMNMNMSIINITIANIIRDGKTYTLYPKKKVYMEAQADDMISSDEIKDALGSSAAKYQKTSVVTSGGVTYICEEYLVEDITYKYYFEKSTEQLKKIEYASGDGSTVVLDINKFVKNPGSSYFEIPSGYKKVTEEEFTNILTGGLSSLISTTKADEK